MRDAAAQGQQDDAAAAAAKGEEAARQLRRAESQMQNGSPDAQAPCARRPAARVAADCRGAAPHCQRSASGSTRKGAARPTRGGAWPERRSSSPTAWRRCSRPRSAWRLTRRIRSRLRGGRRGDEGGAVVSSSTRPACGASARRSARMRAGTQRAAPHADGARREQQLADALDRARRLNGADAGGAKGDTSSSPISSTRCVTHASGWRASRSRSATRKPSRSSADGSRGGRAGSAAPEGTRGQRGLAGRRTKQRRLSNASRTTTRAPCSSRSAARPPAARHAGFGAHMATPEDHEWSRSAPGTEAFKQDYAEWQALARTSRRRSNATRQRCAAGCRAR